MSDLNDKLDVLTYNAFARYENRPFIFHGDVKLSYAQCFDTINSTIKRLETVNAFPLYNCPIAILCDNKLNSLISLLVSIKLKKAYIPLDNLAPIRRNIDILLDNKISQLIISNSIFNDHSKVLNGLLVEFDRIELPEIDSFFLVRKIEDGISVSKEIAYILFTSGSTGKPKGIEITHANALCFINWSKELIVQDGNFVFCSVAPFQFDLSVFDIFVSIFSGGKLLLLENEVVRNPRLMTQMIDDFKVNIIYTTPTVFRLLWSFGKMNNRSFESVNCMIFAGEVMSYEMLNLMKEKCPSAKYFNFYGPTETNVCTYFDATNDSSLDQKYVPIGTSTPFVKYEIDKSVSAIDGELLIAGESVFYGYLNNPKLTNDRIRTIEKERWYLTGDIVFEDENKQIHFIDRLDRMVKIKGYRIELNEIEKVISQFQGIVKAAVVLKKVKGEVLIFAYVEQEDLADEFEANAVKAICLELLPHYMIPNSIILVDRIPLNANSKVDYNTLNLW